MKNPLSNLRDYPFDGVKGKNFSLHHENCTCTYDCI